ncbi:Maf family protein [Flaviflexus massiliensis]|uniref:Maf family protein n=1 Tax=Flaviflexus massiliensis TaxID=1522309 RepID=UPI0006D58042|nr:nucleoside triphosphate pyrophosphatase [Flaviflexus massiliensis]
MRLCLASASAGRLKVLTGAGITPTVHVSQVDEEAILDGMAGAPIAEQVLALAKAKAEAVAETTGEELILGGDSMFDMAGQIVGKPHTVEVARERLRAMRGNSGVLHTGHWLITPRGAVGGVSSATVHVGHMTDEEIEGYLATEEPLHVAGSFTIDGYGGPFIDRIEGDPHGVTGLSLPLFRDLLGQLGYTIMELWDGR